MTISNPHGPNCSCAEEAAMEAVAALCQANHGVYEIEIPDRVRLDAGTIFVEALTDTRLRFTYKPEQVARQ